MNQKTNWSWLLFLALLWLAGPAFSQTANTANTPPMLRDGVAWPAKILLIYQEKGNYTAVITVRFRISATGLLDSLRVDGAPAFQTDSLRTQLTRLNGKWKPQLRNGKPVLSKWLCFRWYKGGSYNLASDCEWKIGEEIRAAYEREQALFQCTAAWNEPYTCRTNFIEGADYFWYPPFYSRPEP